MNLKEKSRENTKMKDRKIKVKKLKREVKGITLIALVVTIIVIGIGLIPYIRYIAIAQHSYGHYFFTFRAQLVTIIAIITGISILIDKSKFKKNIRIGKRKKDE